MKKFIQKAVKAIQPPAKAVYRVKHNTGGTWALCGWYVQARGGEYGYFWTKVFTYPFQSEDEAKHHMLRIAKLDPSPNTSGF